jgi:D-alanyl-D-alanine carboxypeptidase
LSTNYILKFVICFLLFSDFFTGYCAKKSAIVIKYPSGAVAFAKDATEIRFPASLTKMMTVYLIFEAIQQNKITFNTKFKVSKLATMQQPSKLGLRVGEKITVLNLIQALTVKSANDAAIVVAEGLCGSVKVFSRLMNTKAKQLGMPKTNFENPSGLPNPKQVTCAKDIATLGIALFRHFPQYWYLFSLKSFSYQGHTHYTHCKILNWCKGTDGGKTGFIGDSGFNLFVTAKKYNSKGDSMRVFTVVMGGDSSKSRDLYAAYLINKFLDGYTICSPIQKGSKKVKPDKKKVSLMKQIDREEKRKPTPRPEIVIQEESEFSVDEILKAEEVKIEDFDHIYEDNDDSIEIQEEIFVAGSEADIEIADKTLSAGALKIIAKNAELAKQAERSKKAKPIKKSNHPHKDSKKRKSSPTTKRKK